MALGDGPAAASRPVDVQVDDVDVLEPMSTWDASTIEGLDQPSGMDLGPDGNLYVVNALKDQDPRRGPRRQGGATLGQDRGSTDGWFDFLRDPSDPFSAIGEIVTAQDGTVYVADTANRRVQKFSPDGDFLLNWGSFGSGDGRFLEPFEVEVGPDGSVYVVDDVRDDVQRFMPDGKYVQTIGRHGTGDGEMNNTGAIATAPDGTLYNGDWSGYGVQAWDAEGGFLWSLGSRGSDPGQFTFPYDVAIDGHGRLYASDGAR